MTLQQFKEKYIDLYKELNDLVGKTDQESNWRMGNIFRELKALEPIPQTKAEKAFVVKCEVESIRHILDNPFPILTFEEFKAEFWKAIETKNKKIYINSQLKRHEKYLSDMNFYCKKTILIDGQIESLDDFLKAELSNDCEMDLSLFYDDLQNDWNGIAVSLAYILSPIQYIRFLESEESKLESISTIQQEDSKTSKSKNSTYSTHTGFDLRFTDEQLTSLYNILINDEKFLDKKTKLEHFKNAFNGEILEEGHFEPLKWIKTKTTLSLFIGSLNYQNKWKIAETIFENCNGRNLNKTFSNNDGLEIHKKNIKIFRNILA